MRNMNRAAGVSLALIVMTVGAGGTVAAATASTGTAPSAPATTMSDLEVIEAGVAAFYSGDADGSAALFELADRTDDQIRAESAYQKVIGGRLELSCTPGEAPGSFTCLTPYRNAMTDAISEGGGHDAWPVVVEDGVITQFGFTEHTGLLMEMATFLESEGRFGGFDRCTHSPFAEPCASIVMENLDGWAAWRQTLQPADRVKTVVKAWYGANCQAAVVLSWGATDCAPSSVPGQTVAYESILGAQVSVDNCVANPGGTHLSLSCEVTYSNALNNAVGKPASATTREFVLMYGVMPAGLDEKPWYEADYSEDSELRDSFRRFAEGGALADDYAAAGCASTRSSACAHLILDNLDAWATWHKTNG